jgi:hypothetical protein
MLWPGVVFGAGDGAPTFIVASASSPTTWARWIAPSRRDFLPVNRDEDIAIHPYDRSLKPFEVR